MIFLGSKLKKFDVHSKAVDGVNQQSMIGAFVTLIMYCFITFLFYSEMNLRTQSNVVSRMVLDASGSSRRISSTKIDFDVDFYKVSCDRITFSQEVTRGEHHNATTQIEKVPLIVGQTDSCHLYGSLVTDKVGGNFRFEISALKVLKPKTAEGVQVEEFDQTPPDLSHKINRILFLESGSEKIPVSPDGASPRSVPDDFLKLESDPLNGQVSELPLGVGIYQYSIQVVPTTYKPSVGNPKLMNQISVTERQVDFMQALNGVTVAGQFFSDFVGVVFTYDFYPVNLVMQEESIASGGIIDYVTTLCGIIGGIITVFGLFQGCLQQSSKAIMGKRD